MLFTKSRARGKLAPRPLPDNFKHNRWLMNFEFSAFVKAKRRTLGLSQEEFAHHLSCRREAFARLDAVTISRWERG